MTKGTTIWNYVMLNDYMNTKLVQVLTFYIFLVIDFIFGYINYKKKNQGKINRKIKALKFRNESKRLILYLSLLVVDTFYFQFQKKNIAKGNTKSAYVSFVISSKTRYTECFLHLVQ